MNHSRVNADLTFSPSGSDSNHLQAISQASCPVNLASRLTSVYTDFTLVNTMMNRQEACFGSQPSRAERAVSENHRSEREPGPGGST